MREAVKQYVSRFVHSYLFIKNKGFDTFYTIDFDLAYFSKGFTFVEVFEVDARFQIIYKTETITVDEFIQGLNEISEYEILAYVMDYFRRHGLSTNTEEL